MEDTRLAYLFNRYYTHNISADEREEFMGLLLEEHNKGKINLLIEDLLRNKQADFELAKETADDILVAILAASEKSELKISDGESNSLSSSKGLLSFRIRMLVAACIALLLISSGYFFKNRLSSKPNLVSSPIMKDLGLPGGNKAVLILGDGQKIDLESVGNGTLESYPGISINRNLGEVIYQKPTSAKSTDILNTLTTPNGGQYKLVLPDGSKAWLNAGSSLTFPSDFHGKTRDVSMKGEVYFEISPDKQKPFKVRITDKLVNGRQAEIIVLGTHFNVCSYPESSNIKTTLMEGSVRVNTGERIRVLSPGQQALVEVKGSNKEISVKHVDPGTVVAWKEGRFEFNGNIKEIMQQISRWYDLEVVYEGDVGDKSFAGAISRTKNITDVLKMLELTGGIKFVTKGRTIIVKNVIPKS